MYWDGLGAVGPNSITAAMSGRAALSSGNALRKALSEDNVAGKIKNSLGNAAGKAKSGASKGGSSLDSSTIKYDPYTGVKKASQYLIEQGVPREYRKKILESFNIETIKLEKAGDSTYGFLFNKQVYIRGRHF
ncbi:MAG: hypothetical protein IJC76_08155 [Lachnospiraceae bacterium]|nr:hypothetical protein [Lachnospiraceae bacterium]